MMTDAETARARVTARERHAWRAEIRKSRGEAARTARRGRQTQKIAGLRPFHLETSCPTRSPTTMFAALNALAAALIPDPSLDIADNVLVIVAAIKALVLAPWTFGWSRVGLGVRLERGFLRAAFIVADAFSPLSWSYPRDSVRARTASINSRETGRSIPVTIYSASRSSACLPLLLFFHGGGLYMGSHDGEAAIARFFAHRLRAHVVSVGYRKTPEHAWPASLHDGEDVARALLCSATVGDDGDGRDDSKDTASLASGCRRARHFPSQLGILFDRDRVLVVGMSAGGYHAIQVAMALAESGVDVAGHVAIAPMVGPFHSFASHARNVCTSLFPARAISWAWAEYLRDVPEHGGRPVRATAPPLILARSLMPTE